MNAGCWFVFFIFEPALELKPERCMEVALQSSYWAAVQWAGKREFPLQYCHFVHEDVCTWLPFHRFEKKSNGQCD